MGLERIKDGGGGGWDGIGGIDYVPASLFFLPLSLSRSPMMRESV